MPKSILLADDSLTIQKVIELTFSETEYELTTVSNGAEALSTLSRVRPDLVIADVVMPGKNGYEVCEAIKSDPALAEIPVILLSGTFEPFDRDRAEKAKANAIVTKPFDSKNLLVQVESLLASGAKTPPIPVTVPAAPISPAAADTRAISYRSEFRSEAPTEIAAPEFAEFPAENAFDEAIQMTAPAEAAPLDADGHRTAAPESPEAFPLEEAAPFATPPAGEDSATRRPDAGGTPFSDADNVFEFPAADALLHERPTEAPTESDAGRDSWSARADQEITQEMFRPGARLAGFSPGEPIFLHREPKEEPRPTREASGPSAPAEPEAAPRSGDPREVGSDIERLAQGASISDLASMVHRISGPGSLSEDDVERISRRVIESLSEKIVRDIAWEIVPDVAEILVRQRLRELEADTPGESS